jgi:hypothetical protein
VTAIALEDSYGVYALYVAAGGSLCGEPPFWVNAGAFCDVAVDFSPGETRSYPAELVIYSNDPDSGILRISLNGIGIRGPEIDVAPLSILFSDVPVGGARVQESLPTIANRGTEDLTIDSIQLVEPGDVNHFSFGEPSTCRVHDVPVTLEPGSWCSLTMRFSPQERGDHTAELVITSDDVDEPVVRVALIGTGRRASLEDFCPAEAATLGTPMHGDLAVLRAFRDQYLLTNAPGCALADLYYRCSPPIAAFLVAHPSWRAAARVLLALSVATMKHPMQMLVLASMLTIAFRLLKRGKVVRRFRSMTRRAVSLNAQRNSPHGHACPS